MATRYIDKVPNLAAIVNRPDAAGIGMYGGALYANLSGTPFLIAANPAGKYYYVDANSGSDSDDGRSWECAFLTMSKAFTSVASCDTIVFRGKIREQLTTPVQVFDVTVIGAGNRPRHADSTPTGGELAAATWTTPASGATTAPLVKVLQQGWHFENILFAGPTDHACINLFRDAGSGNDERDASHAVIRNCRFASGQDGIHITEVFNTLIENNIFMGMTGHDIKGVAGSGVANPLQGTVRNNVFIGSANHFYVTCSKWIISGNFFDDGETPTTTVVCDTVGSGVGAANNFVVGNYFQTSTANFNSPDVVGTATDVWAVNASIDSTAAGVGGSFEWGN